MSIYSDQSKNYISELVKLNKANLLACGYQKLDVSTAGAKSLTVPTGAKYVEISAVSSNTTTIPMFYLMLADKTLPTATEGLPLRDGTFFDISGHPNLINFRVIKTGADTNTLYIQYYK